MVKELNLQAIRNEFPTLNQDVNGKKLVYFDNGATAQKPLSVIQAVENYYKNDNANIHRGVHFLSQKATDAYEQARVKLQGFINAKHSHEIIFTKGTTDAINTLAFSFGETLQAGDEVLISYMEHHSNIVPWQMVCDRKGAVLKVIPMNDRGELLMDVFDELLTEKTKLVAITHISNALGTIIPVEEIIEKAHLKGAKVMLDGAQSVQHLKVDVQDLDCDFFVFSGHKMFGPTGTGVLYGKEVLLNALPPYQGGGDMIEKVTFEKTSYNELPYKFEAGTPNIAGVIGLGAAVDYLNTLDQEAIKFHEQELLEYAQEQLIKIEGLKIIGTAENKASVVSFIIDGVHPFDIGTLMDKQGIAVRTGHHCAQPIMDFYKVPGTIRASFAFYNTKEEIDLFIKALNRGLNMLR
ncbi:MAG: aminotransferase class V-fold PLP-dependent enzyme [Crocinitomicaceae bacterium]